MSKPIEIDRQQNQGLRAPAFGTALSSADADQAASRLAPDGLQSTGAWTPGPWRVIRDANHAGNRRVISFHPSAVAKVYAFEPVDDDDKAIPNANLIAAAPELYASTDETHRWVRRIQDVLTGYLVPDGYDADEALNRLLEMLDGPEQREIQGRAFAALAKAQGK